MIQTEEIDRVSWTLQCKHCVVTARRNAFKITFSRKGGGVVTIFAQQTNDVRFGDINLQPKIVFFFLDLNEVGRENAFTLI